MPLIKTINKKFFISSITVIALLFLSVSIWGSEKLISISLIRDLLVILIMFSFSMIAKNYIYEKKVSFLNLTYIIFTLIVLMLLSVWFIELFMENLVKKLNESISFYSLASNMVGIVYMLFFVFALAFVIVVLREFLFANSVKTNPVYFNLLILFGILYGITSGIFTETYEHIPKAFAVVTIILMVKNSFGISWIAFLNKKEKLRLLGISVLIVISVSFLIGSTSDNSLHFKTIQTYSIAFSGISVFILLYILIYFGVMVFTVLFHLPTAEAFDRKAEEVSSLQMFSNLINQVLDTEELADTVIEMTLRVSSADASWIVMKQGNSYEILARKNISESDIKEINNHLLSSGDCINLKKAKICSLEKSYLKSRLQEQMTSVIISPLKTQTETKGFLLAAKKEGLLFYEDEAKAINTFSEYASVALENSRLLKESLEKERLEQELNVAREMQKKILPALDPVYDEFEIHSVFIPAFEVGGDFFDFYTDKTGEFSFVIGDVAGKGISAAFVMAEVKGIFESLSKLLLTPKEILIKANDILIRTLHKKNFVSALFGKINLENSELHFSRAGHCPLILIRNGKITKYQPKGLALGLDYTDNFSENLDEMKIKLVKDDLLIFYTDGITESKNVDYEDFGEERFLEILKKNSEKNTDEIAKEIVSEVSLFNNDSSQYDDITLIILKWNKN